jgi:hypothetical protein
MALHRAKTVLPDAAYVTVLGVRLNDSTRRMLRTVYQLLVALIPALPTLALLTEGHPPLEAAIATLIGWGALVTKVLNAAEDRGWIPAFLKAPASDGAQPVPDEPAFPAIAEDDWAGES